MRTGKWEGLGERKTQEDKTREDGCGDNYAAKSTKKNRVKGYKARGVA
jgi:hypothetical protein